MRAIVPIDYIRNKTKCILFSSFTDRHLTAALYLKINSSSNQYRIDIVDSSVVYQLKYVVTLISQKQLRRSFDLPSFFDINNAF